MGVELLKPPLTGPRYRTSGDVGRLALGIAIITVASLLARFRPLRMLEVAVFRWINSLPNEVYEPLYVVMQAGSYGAVFATSLAALVARRPRLARDLFIIGNLTYWGAKVLKETIDRARPLSLLVEVLEAIEVRGRPARGLGFPSGHAATSASLAAAAHPYLTTEGRSLAWGIAGLTSLARVYVGAHMPDDVIGGVALGYSLGALWHFIRGEPPEAKLDP